MESNYIVLWLFLSFTGVLLVSGEEFYVHPNNDSSLCPDGNVSCHSLYEYIADPARLTNDSVYYFLSGTHQLNISVYVSSKRNVTFQGLGEMTEGPHVNVMESPVIIQCDVGVGYFTFADCHTIKLSTITIRNCGTSDSSALKFSSSIDVTLNYMSLQKSSLLALEVDTVINCSLNHCSFYENSKSVFSFNSAIPPIPAGYSLIEMNNCNFTNERSSEIFLNPSSFNLIVDYHINTVKIITMEQHQSITLNSLNSLYNLNVNGLDCIGGGVELYHNSADDSNHTPFIKFTNSNYTNGGMSMWWRGSGVGIFHLDSTVFQNITWNIGYGSALMIFTDRLLGNNLIVTLHNTTFDNNSVTLDGVTLSYAATVGILNVRNCTISNCTFSNNKGSGLGLVNTIATFHGQNNFINNTAYSGGGINLASGSYLYLSNTSLSFINNHATATGGAINAEQTALNFTSGFSTNCFYQFVGQIESNKFYFDNNTAKTAGSVFYGGGVGSTCSLETTYYGISFLNISTFNNIQSGYSLISSEPRGVCFCTDTVPETDSNLNYITLSAFPGGSINFSVAVIGEYNNLTAGILKVFANNRIQLHNVSAAVCASITETIELDSEHQNQVNVSVTPNSFETNFYQPPKTVIVQIEPCPPGFCLSDTLVCGIDFYPLKGAANNYDVASGSVSKKENFWLQGMNVCSGSSVSNTTTNCISNCGLSFSTHCPFDYCVENSKSFSLAYPDEQCNYNRAGKLCGTCSDTMSLMLGSNKCGQCSNTYLTLIIPFGLLGIALVILIIALNLTVTVGTINGLLFFANVIKIYQPLTGFDTIPVLSQFISWINMDFGIETCFYDGMESCGKTGLQFVFPVYLFMLIMLIIALSRWFSKFARLIGNNAVPVLCTLLLLSFTKLLRTILLILSFTNLVDYSRTGNTLLPRNVSMPVWFIDGNRKYFEGCHLPLLVIALLVLVFVFVPYVLFLLFFPLWELCRSRWNKGTTLYLKLKPFFDAYAGPHTDVFRFWPGILLIARIVLAVTVAVTRDEAGEVVAQGVLIAVVAILITILSFGVVYKKSKLHSLDIFYLVCLLAFSVYLSSESAEQYAGNIVVLAFGLLIFLGILVYHIYNNRSVKNVFMKVSIVTKTHDYDEMNDGVEDRDETKVMLPPTTSELDFREPMLAHVTINQY